MIFLDRTLAPKINHFHGEGSNPLVGDPIHPDAGTDVYRQFGLHHPLVVQLLEQLPNSEKCGGYHFTYHHPEKLSSWQATVSSFMTCPISLCFTPFSYPNPGPLILPSLLSFLPPPSHLPSLPLSFPLVSSLPSPFFLPSLPQATVSL